jgi:hypothetical protein
MIYKCLSTVEQHQRDLTKVDKQFITMVNMRLFIVNVRLSVILEFQINIIIQTLWNSNIMTQILFFLF